MHTFIGIKLWVTETIWIVTDAINTMEFFLNPVPGYLRATADTDTGYNYSDMTVRMPFKNPPSYFLYVFTQN